MEGIITLIIIIAIKMIVCDKKAISKRWLLFCAV
jgi:hypothetical protein